MPLIFKLSSLLQIIAVENFRRAEKVSFFVRIMQFIRAIHDFHKMATLGFSI